MCDGALDCGGIVMIGRRFDCHGRTVVTVLDLKKDLKNLRTEWDLVKYLYLVVTV